MMPDTTIAEALILLLREDRGVGDRVYIALMPDNNTESCIVIDMIQKRTAPEGGIYREYWQVNGYCKGRTANAATLALMLEIETKLHRFSGVIGGLHIQRIMAQESDGLIYEDDTQWWRGFRDYAINYTELEGR